MTELNRKSRLLLVISILERFGFWGVRALLVLYMIEPLSQGGLAKTEAEAVILNGWYAGFLYLTPSLGGFTADRLIGPSRAIPLGASLMASGAICLAVGRAELLWPALFLLAIGNGLFKPCLTTMLGQLYPTGDPAREKSYQYLYQTILIGVLASGFICGWLLPNYGFSVSFAVAAFGSALSATLFLATCRSNAPSEAAEPVKSEDIPDSSRATPYRLLAALVLISIVYFAAHSQGGGLITVYVHNHTDRILGGWEVPTLWITHFGALFGIVCTPGLARHWERQVAAGTAPNFLSRLAIGITATGLSFVVMSAAARNGGKSGIAWLLGFHMLSMFGKLCIQPILWSSIERFAPHNYRNLTMGIAMGAISLGYILGGQVGRLLEQYPTYGVFLILGAFCMGTAVLINQYNKHQFHSDLSTAPTLLKKDIKSTERSAKSTP